MNDSNVTIDQEKPKDQEEVKLVKQGEQNEKTDQPVEENANDRNWREFRELRKRERAEKEAAERRAAEKEAEIAALKAAMEVAFNKNSPSPQAYQQYYGMEQEETEEQRIEKKVNALLEQREAKARQEYIEREQREYPQRLARDYPDFNNVVSQENLDYLDYHYPELAKPLNKLPEGYDKWADIYRAVKRFVPNNAEAKRDAIKADINSAKPKSISSPAITPKGEPVYQSYREVEMRRQANWERMQKTMKGL